jgi:catechol 2,3-dioxygenase
MDRTARSARNTASTSEISTLVGHVERVDLRVQSIGRSLAFYRDVVGLDVGEHHATQATLRAPGGPALLALDSDEVNRPAEPRATGLFHLAIRFPDRAALADALARVVEAGHDVGAGDHGVSEALYVDDPDGNGIELYRDRPTEQWPEPEPGERVAMGTAPVDLRGLLGDSRRPGAGAPPKTSIGHIHIQVSDLRRTEDFYTDGLGLDLMTRIADQAAFFSSHGYHHHVGANIWRSRGQAPAARNRAGLTTVTFHVGGRHELERAKERLGRLGLETDGGDQELVVRDPDAIELRFVTKT